jgi:diamine N-acetyltransferase
LVVAALAEPAVSRSARATVALGAKVALRRAQSDDRRGVYEWLAGSDLARAQFGPPLFPERPLPTFESFNDEYPVHCFDGTLPFEGRMLIVCVGEQDVGFLSYRRIHLRADVVELDLALASQRLCGHGYGSEAIQLACEWLQDTYGVNRFVVRPSRRNVRALRAMRRAGFRESDLASVEVARALGLARPRYPDEVLLFRMLPVPRATLRPLEGTTYVFVDTEFTDLDSPRLISVGAVATDATAFYCEISDWPQERSSPFVREHVLPLLDGDAVPQIVAADAFARWLGERARRAPTIIVSDSGFDRWALAELFGGETLPYGAQWQRVAVAYETLDEKVEELGLRRHHALDDARALRHILIEELVEEH